MSALPIQVNLIPGYNRVPPVVKLNQYEYGFTRQFEVYFGGEIYTIPDGSDVRIEGTKRDLTGYSYEAEYSGNVITITIEEQMTVLDGLHTAEIIIIPSNAQRISTVNLVMDVEKGALSQNTPISETEIPAIIDAARSHEIAAAQSAENAAFSEANAYASENNAATSETNAYASEVAAATSASNAAVSETNAHVSQESAAASANAALNYERLAQDYMENAENSANRAELYAGLTVPGLRIDPATMQLIEDDDVDRLYFTYNSSNGELSYELTS